MGEALPDALRDRPLLYVAEVRRARASLLGAHFAHVESVGEITRRRGAVTIGTYVLYRVSGTPPAPGVVAIP
jgi:hypothetical protein